MAAVSQKCTVKHVCMNVFLLLYGVCVYCEGVVVKWVRGVKNVGNRVS